MILTKSPYYLTIPWEHPTDPTTPEKYIVQLYVWSGDKTSVPATPVYEIDNKNPLERVGNSVVNISNYINDSLDYSLESDTTTNVIDANSAVWVKSQVIYYINGVAQSPEYINTYLALKGYNYSIDNTEDNGLTGANTCRVSDNTNYSLPIKVSETLSTDITIISYPNNNINKSFTIPLTENSNELVKNIFIKVNECLTDQYIEVKKDNILIQTLEKKEELKYQPLDIWYLNKYGVLDTITFFKDKVESLKTTSEDYESSNGQPVDGVHQFTKFNTNGQTTFKINSGFVKESNNEKFKQLFLSDLVWNFDGTTFIPINLGSSSLEYKTRQRDRLINYEVEFEYAFNEINNA